MPISLDRNLASKYAKQVDERFTRESQAAIALNNNYDFTGVHTVNVYSIPTAPLGDYTRSGANRYGTPGDLTRQVQSLTLNQDKAFSFIIDKGDKIESQMVMDVGKALSRQIKEVMVPYYDAVVFRKMAEAAYAHGNFATAAITASNAYQRFLVGQERLGNKNVPDKGRVCFCSYSFASLIRQDSAFMRQSDLSQEMINKGEFGMVDGVRMIRVPSSRLPAGCAFMIVHPSATTAPKQLEEYKTHADPPGISGWLVEGRFIFDCFVLNEKADGIYYHGSQAVLHVLDAQVAPVSGSTYRVDVNGDISGNIYYATAADLASLPTATYNQAISVGTGNFQQLPTNHQITLTDGHTVVRVIEVNAALKPTGVDDVFIPA